MVRIDTSNNVSNIPVPRKWAWQVARATESSRNHVYVAEFARPTDFTDEVTIVRLDVLVDVLISPTPPQQNPIRYQLLQLRNLLNAVGAWRESVMMLINLSISGHISGCFSLIRDNDETSPETAWRRTSNVARIAARCPLGRMGNK